PPTAPANLIATAQNTSIALTWTDASNNETGFQIERSTTAGTGFVLLTTTAANVASYTDADVVNGTTYHYRVRAINTGGNSAYTSEVSALFLALPEKPTGFSASNISAISIDLTWVDASDNETAFQIERSITSGSGFALIATPVANSVSYTDTGLTENTTYYYRIRAINANGNSGYTSQIVATTLSPAPPVGLAATASTPSSIGVNWTDASNAETGFQIERSFTSGSGFSLIATAVANASAYLDATLTPNTTYFYRIRAVNATGNSSYSAEVSATTPQSVPAAPSNLAAVSAPSYTVNLSWTDNSSNEIEFEIERSLTSGSGYTFIKSLPANSVAYSDPNLLSGTTYYYRVRAVNGGGYSAYTSEVSVRLP
ncbi:MAG: fibronectin type III domain-containing protein, partial [Flammeovirgaceae bacterium]